jgi:hypothetical protein
MLQRVFVDMLQRVFVAAAVVDGAAVVPMVVPAVSGLLWGFEPEATARFALAYGAALMAGWTGLLGWAARRPHERRVVAVLTVLVVVGLAGAEVYAAVIGAVGATRLTPTWALHAVLIAVFAIALRLDRPPPRTDRVDCCNLDTAPTIREFLDGSHRSYGQVAWLGVGKGVYRPGWTWSIHAGPQTGLPSAAHVGLILSGSMTVRAADGADGTGQILLPGDLFAVGPGHDAWVTGDQPCIALDFTRRPLHDAAPGGPSFVLSR